MTPIVFENDQVRILSEKKPNSAVIEWKQKCGNLLDEEYQPLVKEIRRHIQSLAPKRLLVDMSRCEYHLTPASDSWFAAPLFAFYSDLPVDKIALILPEKLFVTAFFDAARAYEETSQKKLQYFSDLEKAWMWLRQ